MQGRRVGREASSAKKDGGFTRQWWLRPLGQCRPGALDRAPTTDLRFSCSSLRGVNPGARSSNPATCEVRRPPSFGDLAASVAQSNGCRGLVSSKPPPLPHRDEASGPAFGVELRQSLASGRSQEEELRVRRSVVDPRSSGLSLRCPGARNHCWRCHPPVVPCHSKHPNVTPPIDSEKNARPTTRGRRGTPTWHPLHATRPFEGVAPMRRRKIVGKRLSDQPRQLRRLFSEPGEHHRQQVVGIHLRVLSPASLPRELLTEIHQRAARSCRRRQCEREQKVGHGCSDTFNESKFPTYGVAVSGSGYSSS